MNICFASWRGFAGCLTSCRHAARVLGGVAAVVDDGDPPAEALEADLAFLSAWVPAYEPILARRTGRTFGRWHSPLLQTELSREGRRLSELVALLERGALDGLAVDDAEAAAVLARPGVVHLPNVFDGAEFAGVERASLEGVNVALAGEPYGRKNLLVQTAAFGRVREEDWTLHLFGQTRRRAGYARWLELAEIPYVDHGFAPRAEYFSLIAGMDAALCASLAESFGYAAAEAVELGVPTVVSPAVAALCAGPLVVGDPGSVDEVATSLAGAVRAPELAEAQRRALHERAAANAEIARTVLATIEP